MARATNVSSYAKNSDTFVPANQWQISQGSKKRKSDVEVIIPELDQFAKENMQEKNDYQNIISSISKVAIQASQFLQKRQQTAN